MISGINFPNLAGSKAFSYAEKVPYFQANKSITFQPGLNILYGPNGCGKSTILRMIGLCLAAEQGGVSTITETWIDEIVDRWAKGNKESSTMSGIEVLHDGQPILYGNPRNTIGLFGGGAAFDDDFLKEGIANIQSKASTGVTTLQRLSKILAVLEGSSPFPQKIASKLREGSYNDVWVGRIKTAKKQLEAVIDKGQRTVVMDEPESGLSLVAQRNLFQKMEQWALANDFQVIVATHSLCSLGLQAATYIEMKEGFLSQSKAVILEIAHQLLKQGSESKPS